MKKFSLVLILSLSVFVIGCNKSEKTTLSQKITETTNITNDNINNNSNDFDKYNILKIGQVNLDTTEKYEGDDSIDVLSTVTNSSKNIIRNISVTFTGFKNNSIIDYSSGWYEGSLTEGQSVTVESLFNRDDKFDDIKITSYEYYIGKYSYEVDLVSKNVVIYETVE